MIKAVMSGSQSDLITLEVVGVDGMSLDLKGLRSTFATNEKHSLYLDVTWKEHRYVGGREGNVLWLYSPHKSFGVRGLNSVPPFRAEPDYLRPVELGPWFDFPIPRSQLMMMPALFTVTLLDDDDMDAFRMETNPMTEQVLGLKDLNMVWRFSKEATFPIELSVTKGTVSMQVLISAESAPSHGLYDLPKGHEGEFKDVSLSILTEAFKVARRLMTKRSSPVLLPNNEAVSGEGQMVVRDGLRIVYLQGTPEEIGQQHGTLMRAEARQTIYTMLYGVGLAASMVKGYWFMDEIQDASARLLPHMNPDYLVEMDALAQASGLHQQEVLLGNFFPELFHCSGFAVYGEVTTDGSLYHGRILDYMKDVGLEDSAAVFVVKPEGKNAWVNVGYAGFVGTVTAMNAEGVAIGEIGGGGDGNWDGMPMAQLMREVMENAGSVDDGVTVFQDNPRTCEYYYVLSQANPNRAVGLYATHDKLEEILPGKVSLPHASRPVKDALLMSSGNRYKHLVNRVEGEYGQINEAVAWDLMSPPVCMRSNIQSVLFHPESLDFWVAYSTGNEVASVRKPVELNLQELLDEFSKN